MDQETISASAGGGARQEVAFSADQIKELMRQASTEAVAAERLRKAEIENIGVTFGLQEDAKRFADEGKSVQEFKDYAFAAFAARKAKSPETVSASVESDCVDKMRKTATAYLCARYDDQLFKEEAQIGREYMGWKLPEIARECLRIKGLPYRGMSIPDMVMSALTTSDLPNILTDGTNKFLRMGYTAAPQTFKPFCRRRSVSDFKEIKSILLSGAPALVKVNESGEIDRGKLVDSKETFYVMSYAIIVPISRKTIVNDDMSSLTKLPMQMGASAASKESDVVYAILTTNGAMADNANLFSSTHANFVAGGSGAAPSKATLEAGFLAMALQKGLNEQEINNTPRFIISGTTLQPTIEELMAPVTTALAVVSSTPGWIAMPGYLQALTRIYDKRIDRANSPAWFLASNPNENGVDTIEYAYLEGQEAARIETRTGFEVDGIEMKVAHDFGAGAVDFRGLYMNDGN